MLRLAADENLKNDIVRALRRRRPDIDLVRVQDVGLMGADDAAVLAWAAGELRLLLTHDVSTLATHAYSRVGLGLDMPGVLAVGCDMSIGQAVEDILLVCEFSTEDDWDGQVRCLPL